MPHWIISAPSSSRRVSVVDQVGQWNLGKQTTLPSKFVMFSVSKSGPDPVETLGLSDVSRAHCLPPKRRFLEVLKIICALIYQALTSLDPRLPDKKLLPFCRGPPSVGDVSVCCTRHPNTRSLTMSKSSQRRLATAAIKNAQADTASAAPARDRKSVV